MPRVSPALAQGIGYLSNLDVRITSLISGPHRGAAHGEGRAVDVDQFGGVDVGVNESTIRGIVAAVRSGRFKRIGTIVPLVKALAPWAAQNGVQMFYDDKPPYGHATGNHVHFEVDP